MRFIAVAVSVLGLVFVMTGVARANDSPYVGSNYKNHTVKKQKSYTVLASRSKKHTRSKKHRKAKKRYSSSGTYRGIVRAFPRRIRPPGRRVFIFSPKYKAWGAYNATGQLVGYGRASGGANWCKKLGRPCRTPRGTFTLHRKGSSSCRSGRYPRPRGGAPMPYCMFFKTQYAIHGSPYVPNYNASHGCIRVKVPAAYWLHRNFMRYGTRVIVTSY